MFYISLKKTALFFLVNYHTKLTLWNKLIINYMIKGNKFQQIVIIFVSLKYICLLGLRAVK